MKQCRYRWFGLLGVLLLAPLASGCGVDPSPLSPTPETDPARAARASTEMDEVVQRNREAEARFFRTRGTPEPQ